MLLSKIIIFLKTVLPVLLAIFFVVLVGILLTRIVVSILLHFARKKYQSLVKKIQSKRIIKAEKVMPKNDDARFIKKENPRKLVERINSIDQSQNGQNQEPDEVQIVDLVKPVGFWTSMVLGQKLTYLVSSAKIMNYNSHKGFWVSMVEAQGRAAGRQKGKSL